MIGVRNVTKSILMIWVVVFSVLALISRATQIIQVSHNEQITTRTIVDRRPDAQLKGDNNALDSRIIQVLCIKKTRKIIKQKTYISYHYFPYKNQC